MSVLLVACATEIEIEVRERSEPGHGRGDAHGASHERDEQPVDCTPGGRATVATVSSRITHTGSGLVSSSGGGEGARVIGSGKVRDASNWQHRAPKN